MAEESVLRIPARLEGLDLILSFVSFLLDTHGCTPKARTQLRMAVEEVFVNVTLYAYPSGEGWAEICGSVDNGVATFRLRDGGKPFNPLEKPDPDTLLSGDERGVGGLGIFMVKTMVDELTYTRQDGCNELTFRKKL